MIGTSFSEFMRNFAHKAFHLRQDTIFEALGKKAGQECGIEERGGTCL